MRLFSSDLYRSFVTGFALGAVLVVGASAGDFHHATLSHDGPVMT